MKKYLIYYSADNYAEGQCPHEFKEFDSIYEAVDYFEKLKEKEKWLLTPVTWKKEIKDMTNINEKDEEVESNQ